MKTFIRLSFLLLLFTQANAQNPDLLNKANRWVLVHNKIEKKDIQLATYDKLSLDINTLIMQFKPNGKIDYDYECDPNIEYCAGINFLDIDTDESAWQYDAQTNHLILTIKGGYASLDDFKFKREYSIEPFGDGYVLHKVKEYYFADLKKQARKEKY